MACMDCTEGKGGSLNGPDACAPGAPAASLTVDTARTADSDSGVDDRAETGATGDTMETADTVPPPPDQDGDGFETADGDCDDLDPTVYPGAVDPCDGVDQDCDGDPIGPGMCSVPVDLEAYSLAGLVGNEPNQNFTALSRQLDGVADALWYNFYAFTPLDGRPMSKGAIGFSRSVPTEPDEAWADHLDALWLGRSPDYWINIANLDAPADANGDGYDDFWVNSPGYGGWLGRMFLVLGPPERWSAAGVYIDEAAAAVVEEEKVDYDFAIAYSSGHDIDGDGYADLIIEQGGSDPSYFDKGWYLLRGAADLAGTYHAEDLPFIEIDDYYNRIEAPGTLTDWEDYTSTVTSVPDQDGDGVREVVATTQVGMGFLRGDEFAGATGSRLNDIFTLVPTRDENLVAAGTLLAERPIGDVDGDGIDEFVIVESLDTTDSDDPKCVYAYSLNPYEAGAVLRGTERFVLCPHEDATSLSVRMIDDMDLDGTSDLFAWSTGVLSETRGGAEYEGAILPTSLIALGGHTDMGDIAVPFTDSADDLAANAVTALLDDDPNPELIFGGSYGDEDPEYYGRTMIFPGFEIPVGDLSKW